VGGFAKRLPARGIPPLVAEPYRLWSLLEMLKAFSAPYLAVMVMMERARTSLIEAEHDLLPRDFALMKVQRATETMREQYKLLPLSESFGRQLQRLLDAASARPADISKVQVLVDEIQLNLHSELGSWRFLALHKARFSLYAEAGNWAAEASIGDSSGEVESELTSASRCYALEEWTACVFHLMRAVESALRIWSTHLGSSLKMPLQEANIQELINAATKKLEALGGETRTEERSQELQYFGSTLAHFKAIKSAWRNHVAHSKKTYDERDAEEISRNVRTFMRELSEVKLSRAPVRER
jgi:hypothetical protein